MIISVVEDTFKQMCHVAPSAEPVAGEKDIIEYDGRMRLFPMEKFNAPAYVAIVNYYLSPKHLEAKDAVGTFILYFKEDLVERLFKAFGRSASESENEQACLDVVGDLCQVIAENLKKQILALDLADLTLSAPYKYKNAVLEGAQFDYNLFKKQEVAFSFWKEKCVVVEACMGHVPTKGR